MTDKIKQQTVVGQVMEKIRNLIASGLYKSGDKIPTEQELAEKFGIGRSSIREAIKVFNYIGVLESRTARGTFVCDRSSITSEALTWSILLGNDELYDLIEFRGALELWCFMSLAREIKENPGAHDKLVSGLERIIASMTTAEEEEDRRSLVRLDYSFHKMIIDETGNKIVISMYETLKSFLYEEIKKAHLSLDALPQQADNHRRLLTALKSGNQEIVAGAVKRHFRETSDFVRDTLERERKAQPAGDETPVQVPAAVSHAK
jgi:DNA-binding FadR family transcriptional regulator